MTITLDRDQTEILADILRSAINQLRIESARTDSHDFREGLHARERVVEKVLAQLAPPS
jgi:hypothetical protein